MLGIRRAAVAALITMTTLALPSLADAASPNTWTAAGSPGAGRFAHVAAPLPGGKVLVAGGIQETAVFLNTSQIYDPATDHWTDTPSLGPTPRARAGVIALPNGNVIVAGGISGPAGAGLDTGVVYDPVANSWTPVSGTMAAGHADPIVALLPTGKVLIAGGADAAVAPTNSASLYDPSTNTFLPAHPMGTARASAVSALLPGGKVLVAGGANASGHLPSGEVYDPATDSWTPVSNSMSAPRTLAAAAPLPGGKVLVAGGERDTNTTTATTDIYDPVANKFTPGPTMDAARAEFGLAPLADGRVVAAGGDVLAAGMESFDGHMEIYDPGSNTWIQTGTSLPFPEGAFTLTGLPRGQLLMVGGTNFPFGAALPVASLYTPPTAPDQPSAVSAVSGNGSATVTFAPPSSSGGLPVHYEIRASSGHVVDTQVGHTSATVTGLTNGRRVTFTVTAINAIGASRSSGASNAVTPSAPPRLTITKVPGRLKLRSFLKGISFSITPSEPESVQLSLVGGTNRATIARAFNLTLASKKLRVSARTRVKLTPSRRLVGNPRSAQVQLLIVATDPAGSKTTKKTIRIHR
jgi:hypothetical protein